MNAADWVQLNLRPKKGPAHQLVDFERRAVELLAKAFNTGVYNLCIKWDRVDWAGRYVRVVLFTGGLSTFDFDHLTRLVIAGHDECIRVDLIPVSRSYLAIFLSPRERGSGNMSTDHPTIEQAIAKFRRLDEARPLDDYHEDYGNVLWWSFPITEAPYVGSPNDSDWPGRHTHWTPLPALPATPREASHG